MTWSVAKSSRVAEECNVNIHSLTHNSLAKSIENRCKMCISLYVVNSHLTKVLMSELQRRQM
ncbi:UNVERIFIED_CONTAM: hypothetical protein NCL1_34313 [Trichonephila clavipes]